MAFYPTNIVSSGGTSLPAMPDSPSNVIEIQGTVNNSYDKAKWCGVKNTVTKMYGIRTGASSATTVNCLMYHSDGNTSQTSLSISSNNTWHNTTVDFSDVLAVSMHYSGSMSAAYHISVYFD